MSSALSGRMPRASLSGMTITPETWCQTLGLGWIQPPLSNSWMMNIIWLYIELNKTPNIDYRWVGAVPKV